MNEVLMGSDLTRELLEQGSEKVWCAVSNNSDQDALAAIDNFSYNCTGYIISSTENCFFCNTGECWLYAVPIKKTELKPYEAGF